MWTERLGLFMIYSIHLYLLLYYMLQTKTHAWMQNIRKKKRQSGKAYVTKRGKLIKERLPKSVNCNCRHKCIEQINNEERIAINAEFWELSDYAKQQMYLSQCIQLKKCKRALVGGSRRDKTLTYTLRSKQVCKQFFLKTLNISDGAISVFIKKSDCQEVIDKRGHHGRHKKIDVETRRIIKEHIESFPAVESHYTRSKSKRLYLASNLNISKMFQLFNEKHEGNSIKENMYRRIFCNEYNYSFHKPKKDTCYTCERYRNSDDKEILQEAYDEHIINKKRAREEKEADKEEAKINSKLRVFTFDLQSVLTSPCSNVSSLYYSRKFASFNNTFFDLASKEGYCFLWDETQGQRGSDEIGTTIIKMLSSFEENVTDVILYSDCCGGQNRNRYIAALLFYAIRKFNLNTITIKYLESGHTQMEADCMHSTIERAKRNISIYSPEEWPTILRLSRRKQPYIVERMFWYDIYDIKEWFSRLGHTFKKNNENNSVNWLKIKQIKVEKVNPNLLLYKEKWDSEWQTIDIMERKRKKSATNNCDTRNLCPKFKQQLAISSLKYNDLKGLCTKNVIPKEFHSFYLNLQPGGNQNCLDEPDVEEDIPEDEY